MKLVIVLAFVAVLVSLAAAGFFMLKRNDQASDHPDGGQRMARALAVRVGLSVLLFLVVLLAYLMGWIQPTGLPLH